MKELSFEIKDKIGLHARPAGVLATNAKSFECEITVKCGDKQANAKRLLSLMSLGATSGSTLHIIFDGADEREALEKIREVLNEQLG